jgi:hypothetical protein
MIQVIEENNSGLKKPLLENETQSPTDTQTTLKK